MILLPYREAGEAPVKSHTAALVAQLLFLAVLQNAACTDNILHHSTWWVPQHGALHTVSSCKHFDAQALRDVNLLKSWRPSWDPSAAVFVPPLCPNTMPTDYCFMSLLMTRQSIHGGFADYCWIAQYVHNIGLALTQHFSLFRFCDPMSNFEFVKWSTCYVQSHSEDGGICDQYHIGHFITVLLWEALTTLCL